MREGHELTANGDSENDEVEDSVHVKVHVRALCDGDSADVEKGCLGQVDESTGDTTGTPLEKSDADTSGKAVRNRFVKLSLQDWLKRHGTYATNVENGLAETVRMRYIRKQRYNLPRNIPSNMLASPHIAHFTLRHNVRLKTHDTKEDRSNG